MMTLLTYGTMKEELVLESELYDLPAANLFVNVSDVYDLVCLMWGQWSRAPGTLMRDIEVTQVAASFHQHHWFLERRGYFPLSQFCAF